MSSKIHADAEATILVPVRVKMPVIITSDGDRSVSNMLTLFAKGNVRDDFDVEIESFDVQDIGGHGFSNVDGLGEALTEAIHERIDNLDSITFNNHEVTDSK